MKSIIAVIVIALILPVHGEQKSPKPTGDQKQVQSIDKPSPPASHIVVIEQEHPADQGNGPEKHSKKYLCELLSANNLPSLLLFFAGLGGIAVGVYTLRDIRRQTGLLGDYVKATKDGVIAAKNSTEAMEKSVRLQEIQMTQWLDLRYLELDRRPVPHGATKIELKMSFDIINPTKLPLTLKDIEITVFDDQENGFFYRSLEHTLIPDASYPVSIKIPVADDHVQEYRQNLLIIPVTGLATFEDAFEKIRHHGFGFNCRWRNGNWEFTVYDKAIPNKGKEQQEGEQAN